MRPEGAASRACRPKPSRPQPRARPGPRGSSRRPLQQLRPLLPRACAGPFGGVGPFASPPLRGSISAYLRSLLTYARAAEARPEPDTGKPCTRGIVPAATRRLAGLRDPLPGPAPTFSTSPWRQRSRMNHHAPRVACPGKRAVPQAVPKPALGPPTGPPRGGYGPVQSHGPGLSHTPPASIRRDRGGGR